MDGQRLRPSPRKYPSGGVACRHTCHVCKMVPVPGDSCRRPKGPMTGDQCNQLGVSHVTNEDALYIRDGNLSNLCQVGGEKQKQHTFSKLLTYTFARLCREHLQSNAPETETQVAPDERKGVGPGYAEGSLIWALLYLLKFVLYPWVPANKIKP